MRRMDRTVYTSEAQALKLCSEVAILRVRVADLEKQNALLRDAAMVAKQHLINDLVEPGRTVFWKLVDALKVGRDDDD